MCFLCFYDYNTKRSAFPEYFAGMFSCNCCLTICSFCTILTNELIKTMQNLVKNLYYFYLGDAPDWPPCDAGRNGGKTGNEFSPIAENDGDDFVS